MLEWAASFEMAVVRLRVADKAAMAETRGAAEGVEVAKVATMVAQNGRMR